MLEYSASVSNSAESERAVASTQEEFLYSAWNDEIFLRFADSYFGNGIKDFLQIWFVAWRVPLL